MDIKTQIQNNLDDLLKSYFDGKLSDQQKFELDKLALDDPFLLDAIEGYRRLNHYPTSNISSIHEKLLNTKTQPEKFSFWNTNKRKFIYAAASLAAIVCLGILFKTNFSDNSNEKNIAQDLQKEIDDSIKNKIELQKLEIEKDSIRFFSDSTTIKYPNNLNELNTTYKPDDGGIVFVPTVQQQKAKAIQYDYETSGVTNVNEGFFDIVKPKKSEETAPVKDKEAPVVAMKKTDEPKPMEEIAANTEDLNKNKSIDDDRKDTVNYKVLNGKVSGLYISEGEDNNYAADFKTQVKKQASYKNLKRKSKLDDLSNTQHTDSNHLVVNANKMENNANSQINQGVVSNYNMNVRVGDKFNQKNFSPAQPTHNSFYKYYISVKNEKNELIPYAKIDMLNVNFGTYVDNNGTGRLISLDSTIQVNIKGYGYQSQNATLIPGRINNVTLKENTKLSENKLRGNITDYPVKVYFENDDELESLTPSIGLPNFITYLNNGLSEVNEGNNSEKRKRGKIEFEIDKNGQPTDIKVRESLGTAIDNQALKVIKEGPSWKKNKKNKRARVIVEY